MPFIASSPSAQVLPQVLAYFPKCVGGALRSQHAFREDVQTPPTPAVSKSVLLRSCVSAAAAALLCATRPRACRAEEIVQQRESVTHYTLQESLTCDGVKLVKPRFVGGGVQAEVFSAEMLAKTRADLVALKVSRLNNDYAAKTFSRERMVLGKLEAAGVPGVVRCLAEGEIATDAGARRGLVLSPFLPRAQNVSVKSGRAAPLPKRQDEAKRMQQLMKTAVRILEAGVAGVDVQVLQQEESGELLWIDFTEAALLLPSPTGSTEIDAMTVEAPIAICPEYENRYVSAKAAVIGFATEVFLLVPPASRPLAVSAVTSELRELAASAPGTGRSFQGVWRKLPWWGKAEEPAEASELAEAVQKAVSRT